MSPNQPAVCPWHNHNNQFLCFLPDIICIFVNTHVCTISVLELLLFQLGGELRLRPHVSLNSISNWQGQGDARLQNLWNAEEQPGRSPGACGISRSAEPVLLSPWGSLTQDLKSINLLAIKNTSKLSSLI